MRTHHQKGALGAKQQLPKHTFHPNIYLFHLKCKSVTTSEKAF